MQTHRQPFASEVNLKRERDEDCDLEIKSWNRYFQDLSEKCEEQLGCQV